MIVRNLLENNINISIEKKIMSRKKVLIEQLATDGSLINRHTVIIKKPFVLLPMPTEEPPKQSPRKLKQLRSRSQSKRPRNNILHTEIKPASIQNSPRFTITSRQKVIRTTEQKKSQVTIKQDSSTLHQYKSSIITAGTPKIRNNLKDYLNFIRAQQQQFYQISANFESLRKRNRRQPLKTNQKQIYQYILNIFMSIYQNLQAKDREGVQQIFNSCQAYFGCFQKVKIQVLFSIHYPSNLHSKLRPFIICQRLIIFTISALSIDNSIDKLSSSHRQSLKLVVQLLIQAFSGLFQPIKQLESQVVTNINETFRILKAIGQLQKKVQIIQRQMRKINSNRDVFIEQDLKYLINAKQGWSIEKLVQKQMKIAWDYLKIPPVPYLPVKTSPKPYTLLLQLDHTLIYYDKQTKILKYRPYIDLFLHKASQNFEIIAFTRADHKYTSILITQIEKNNRYFSFILCKQHLSYGSQGKLIKDITRLGRELNELIIVDHCPQMYKNYAIHGISISSWFGDKSDKELERLLGLLQQTVKFRKSGHQKEKLL